MGLFSPDFILMQGNGERFVLDEGDLEFDPEDIHSILLAVFEDEIVAIARFPTGALVPLSWEEAFTILYNRRMHSAYGYTCLCEFHLGDKRTDRAKLFFFNEEERRRVEALAETFRALPVEQQVKPAAYWWGIPYHTWRVLAYFSDRPDGGLVYEGADRHYAEGQLLNRIFLRNSVAICQVLYQGDEQKLIVFKRRKDGQR